MSRNVNIYIIDDDPVFHFGMKKMVQNSVDSTVADFTFHSFVDPEAAISEISDRKRKNLVNPDIVFIDLNMPKVDGIECFNRLKHIILSSRFFIISSTIAPDDVDRINNIKDICGFVQKPITQEMFSELMLSIN